jgi:hypothetical protein
MQYTFNSIKEVINYYSKKGILFDVSQIDELKDVAREHKLEALLKIEAVDDNLYELLTPQQLLKVSNSGLTIWSGSVNAYLTQLA